jgi:diguanylate cyclase (GGDEF)-like protein
MLTEAKRNAQKVAVLRLDLDDFKRLNDFLGHELGDRPLVEAANRLKTAVRKAGTVGRLRTEFYRGESG